MMTTHQPSSVDLAAIKARQQVTWSVGDYSILGEKLTIVSEELCEAVDLHAGQRVLDVATGSGTTAIAAARRCCEVIGIDFVPALLVRGRERAAAERLQAVFEEGDAENIPFPDTAFDVVLSTFGLMFAPQQEKAASELLRVCRPSGTVGLANWTPGGLFGEMSRIIARYAPPPPGLKSTALWGTKERIKEGEV